MKLSTAAVFAALCLSLVACKPDPAVRKGELVDRGTKNPVPPPGGATETATDNPVTAPGPTGSINGTVLFNGKPPVMATIDTSMDPACGMGANSGKIKAEQYVVNDGKLANVFVYVKSGPQAAMQAAPLAAGPSILDQKGCRYVPHVIGVMQGGYVEFHNSDPTMHNIHTMPTDVGNETVDVSQGPMGAPQAKQFTRPELMIPVRCNNHPWMNAFINVAPTTFWAVTDANGKFNISRLPPGDYVFGAVHEKLGEHTMNVHIAANTASKADVTFAAR